MLVLEKSISPSIKIEIYNDRPSFPFKELTQVHGAEVLWATKTEPSHQADGLIENNPSTASHELVMAIKTADCLPIFFIGQQQSAVIHAGWRGLAQGIISEQKIQALAPHTVLIGPCIHARDYEVGSDFAKNFPNSDSLKNIQGRICFDLIEEAAKQINDCYNISSDTSLAENTFEHPQLNSWRENKTEKRNYNILKICPPGK